MLDMRSIKAKVLMLTQALFRLVSGVLFLVAVLPGCAVWEFGMTRYENVTGYFNTYYNASTLFDEALTEVNTERLNQAFQQSQSTAPQPVPMIPQATLISKPASSACCMNSNLKMSIMGMTPRLYVL